MNKEEEKWLSLWENIQQLNLDVGLKQETINDVQFNLQKKLNDDQIRNLKPHSEARLAMLIWGKKYSEQNGGCMDFWENLSESDKNSCRKWLREINRVPQEKDWIEPALRPYEIEFAEQ